ncbi:MAG: hypothetical protein N3G22_02705 [Candidatus Micrarchaeota archaeon]|nr:hypothetical protein [Candidatus Micrarchaeota archaeon]
MVDLKMTFEASKLSIAGMVGLWLLATVLSFAAPFWGGLLGLAQFFIINPLLLGYAGYLAAKKFGSDLVGGAAAGALSGLVASAVMGVAGLLLVIVGIGSAASKIEDAVAETGIYSTFLVGAMIIGALISVAIHTVGGAVCGTIGAFVAKRK